MKEIDQILKLWEATRQSGQSAVLATVVKTSGSSYRVPGARLILTRTGQRAGSISGGCLEDDLVKKAWWLSENGPSIRRYDTTPEGEIGPGFGLGCNGVIHLLLERLRPDEPNVLQLISQVRELRRPAVVAHVIGPSDAVGKRLEIDCAGDVHHSLNGICTPDLLEDHARTALADGNSYVIPLNSCEVFIETLVPAVRLLIFGAGDDAVPLSEMAKYIGWSVFVIDGRSHYARREKFPSADVVEVRSAGQPVANAVDPWTVAVLMTHSYSQDLEILRLLAANPPRYLGLLGPRKRSEQLFADASLDPAKMSDSFYSPMGLDLGADGPEQVALAVIAEIQASLNGRDGGHLRQRRGSIHSKEETGDFSPFHVRSIVCA